ncbi:DUF411 domain-containing protein [Profundibacterium mesophilum]|uniref:Metal-binding protein General function prediction only n=1 Tax=Profundibacterium mesophilum KAUST100406-0324 TaxID=1037889 RepID=A0A921TG76_9RHOB|nr:DUF411 domain-containing protein [Profundibacterium mesophilum]KAF0677174.1 putative metal-binding protein General function prediction only [Profundibacterium mesophilum KAUST100406-0324]
MKTKRTLGAAATLTAAGILGFATLGLAGDDTASDMAATVAADRQMTIWRDPSCGCCDAYADYMEGEGYHVTRIDDRDFDKRSVEVGVPEQGLGCHLAEVDGYYVSGLVPADIIDRLTTERPEITGITLPGMPSNAPGMAGKSGTLKTYAFGEDGVTVYSNE